MQYQYRVLYQWLRHRDEEPKSKYFVNPVNATGFFRALHAKRHELSVLSLERRSLSPWEQVDDGTPAEG